VTHSVRHMNNIAIDFGQMKDIAYRGVRRTAAFMGLGINAARDDQFKKYQLSNISMVQVLPDKLDDKGIAHIKEEFEKWVISNGLRELVESFGLFLDKVHTACLFMATHKKQMSGDDAEKFGPAFERKGVEDKLSTLRNRFGVTSDKEKYFNSINQARNCITHRKGIVGHEDLRGEKTFRLIWWGFDIYAETSSGEKHSLMPPIPEKGLLLEEGGKLMLHIKDRIIEYKIGDIVNLSPNDLGEICFLVHLSTDDIVRSAQAYAKNIGIEERKIERSVEQANPVDTE
jgi:hypothetical protein